MDDYRKEMEKLNLEDEKASNKVALLINNFQKFTKISTELDSLLNAIHAMAKRDRSNYPDHHKEYKIEDELSTLSNDDFMRLCEIARVISKNGIKPFDYCCIGQVMELTGELNSAIFKEVIARLKKDKN